MALTAAQKALLTVRRCLRSPVIGFVHTKPDTYEKRVTYNEVAPDGTVTHPFTVLNLMIRPSTHGALIVTQPSHDTYVTTKTNYKWVEPAWVIDGSPEIHTLKRPADNGHTSWVAHGADRYDHHKISYAWSGTAWVKHDAILTHLDRPIKKPVWIKTGTTYKHHVYTYAWSADHWVETNTVDHTETLPADHDQERVLKVSDHLYHRMKITYTWAATHYVKHDTEIATYARPADNAKVTFHKVNDNRYESKTTTYAWNAATNVWDKTYVHKAYLDKPANTDVYTKKSNDLYDHVITTHTWSTNHWIDKVVVTHMARPHKATAWVKITDAQYHDSVYTYTWTTNKWTEHIAHPHVVNRPADNGTYADVVTGNTHLKKQISYTWDSVHHTFTKHLTTKGTYAKPTDSGHKTWVNISPTEYREKVTSYTWVKWTWDKHVNDQNPIVKKIKPANTDKWNKMNATTYEHHTVVWSWGGATWVSKDTKVETKVRPAIPKPVWVKKAANGHASTTAWSLETVTYAWVTNAWVKHTAWSGTQTRSSTHGHYHVTGSSTRYYRYQITYTWDIHTHKWVKHDTKKNTYSRPSTHGAKYCRTSDKHQLEHVYTFTKTGSAAAGTENGAWHDHPKDHKLVDGKCGYSSIPQWTKSEKVSYHTRMGTFTDGLITSGNKIALMSASKQHPWISVNKNGIFSGNSVLSGMFMTNMYSSGNKLAVVTVNYKNFGVVYNIDTHSFSGNSMSGTAWLKSSGGGIHFHGGATTGIVKLL